MVIGWALHRKFSAASVVARLETGEIRAMRQARLDHADRGHPSLAGPVSFGHARDDERRLRLAMSCRSPDRNGTRSSSRASAGDSRVGQERGKDRSERRRSAGPVLAPRKIPRNLPGDVGGAATAREAAVSDGAGRLAQRLKNRIQAILHRLGLLHKFTDLFGNRGREWLGALELPTASREAIGASCVSWTS